MAQSQENIQQENVDENKEKFTPNVVHLNRQNTKTVTDFIEFLRFVKLFSREERKYNFIIDDNKFESLQASIVDLAFGFGFEFLNI